MNREMLLLAERLVVAVEGMSEDVKNMSAYMYDLSHCVSCILSERKEKESTSLISCDGSYFPAAEQRASTESEYPWQCGQTEGDSVPHSDALEDEAFTPRDVSHTLNHSENSHVFSSASELLETRERVSVSVPQQLHCAWNSSNYVVNDDVAADVKNEADAGDDWLPLQEDSHAHVTEAAMDDGNNTSNMAALPGGDNLGAVTHKLEIDPKLNVGQKVFRCAVCRKTYTCRNSLMVHMRMHSEARPFKCSVCEKSFRMSCNLKDHMRLHTGEKPFVCSVCGKAFTQKVHLTGHIRSHTGEKPYKCTLCGKAFARHILNSHMRVHSAERPFPCRMCGIRFTASRYLQRHRLLEHGVAFPVFEISQRHVSL